MEQNSTDRRTRRRYSLVEKVKILREHLETFQSFPKSAELSALRGRVGSKPSGLRHQERDKEHEDQL